MAPTHGNGTLAGGRTTVLLNQFLTQVIGNRSVVLFGGKGGVGKTTLSATAALAVARARPDARLLLVSTDPAHNLGHLFERQFSDQPERLHDNLWVLEADPQRVAAEHFDTVAETVRGMMPPHLHGEVTRYFRAATASPGAHEAALLEHMAQLSLSPDWDLVIFDTAPTGHTLRLLELPETMTTWAEAMLSRRRKSENYVAALNALPGPDQPEGTTPTDERNARIRTALYRRKELLENFHRLLTDSARCGFIPVTAAERLPVQETLELTDQLRSSRIPVVAVMINRRTPAGSEGVFAERREREAVWAQRVTETFSPVFQVPLYTDGDLEQILASTDAG
ncbi:arsenic-transporting ATPase [Auritidibacter sp. NML100628]|nr:arsenic-transporting ATPase [Auritidibacter sp. NML100628]